MTLLSLPAELRIEIYRYLLVTDFVILFKPFLFPPYAQSFGISILLTCRQIYQEASDVLYKKNCFSLVPWLSSTKPILGPYSDSILEKVTSLRYKVNCDLQEDYRTLIMMELLAVRAPQLRFLEITFHGTQTNRAGQYKLWGWSLNKGPKSNFQKYLNRLATYIKEMKTLEVLKLGELFLCDTLATALKAGRSDITIMKWQCDRSAFPHTWRWVPYLDTLPRIDL
jgi:hypothetical protein